MSIFFTSDVTAVKEATDSTCAAFTTDVCLIDWIPFFNPSGFHGKFSTFSHSWRKCNWKVTHLTHLTLFYDDEEIAGMVDEMTDNPVSFARVVLALRFHVLFAWGTMIFSCSAGVARLLGESDTDRCCCVHSKLDELHCTQVQWNAFHTCLAYRVKDWKSWMDFSTLCE